MQKSAWKSVRAINLIEQDTPLQCDFFTDMSAIDKREKLDLAVENIRYRFGKDAVKNAVLLKNTKLPTVLDNGVIMPTGMVN